MNHILLLFRLPSCRCPIVSKYPLQSFNIFLNNLDCVLLKLLESFPNDLVIIGGDFNARIGPLNQLEPESMHDHSTFSPARVSLDITLNKIGPLLVECLERHGLVNLNGRSISDNPAKITYCRAVGRSVNDLTSYNFDLLQKIKDFEIKHIVTNSDHFSMHLMIWDINNYQIKKK